MFIAVAAGVFIIVDRRIADHCLPVVVTGWMSIDHMAMTMHQQPDHPK